MPMEAMAATISCGNLSSTTTHQCKWKQRLRRSSDPYRTVFFSNSFRSGNGRLSQSLITRAAANTDNKGEKKAAGEEEIVDSSEGFQQPPPQPKITLDDVNPVGLGRKSRQLFDEMWRKFSGLGQISRTTRMDDKEALDALLIREGPMCEFAIPGAQNTTVLVVGATSRIGRIVVRKLMLRGYSVKVLLLLFLCDEIMFVDVIFIGPSIYPYAKQALVRKADDDVVDVLPRSVEIVIGDDYNNKLAQLRAGKSSKSKLLLAKFKSEESLNGWEVRQGTYFQDVVAAKYDGGMDAKFEYTETGEAVFSGYVFTRGGYVELSTKLSLPLGSTLDRYEGLILSVGGNGRSYVLILEAGPSADTTQSKLYFSRFSTKAGFCRVRIPFSSFRPVKPDDPPLDPFLVHTLTIRFEPRRQRAVEGPAAGVKQQDLRSFELILEYIKALPAGEDSLRRSGLGYTIIRPGPLKEEPGGQRALIFDQGNRITQAISCADVADICVKALHDSTARNKSFDVCYEYIAEQGRELYELVAHLPDKANNYLTPALSVLEKNT
ncbi:hypothetical protein SDJN02_19840, partial [Cucurbita argyrosperma subsp. argyrosperma]